MSENPLSDLFDLTGRAVAITGGCGDIGQTMASGLSAYGADLFLMDLRPVSEIDDHCRKIEKKSNTKVRGCQVDVSDYASVDRGFKKMIDLMRKIDVLINAAGIIRRGAIIETTEADLDRILNVNLKGTFFCTKAAGPYFIRQEKGKVINIASTNAEAGVKNHAAYCASKGGVLAFTKAMAIEWAAYGICVNALSPNVVRTRMTADRLAKPGEYEKSVSKIPLGRLLEPEDLVGAAVFLASSASDSMTGHVLNVDGGYMAQ